MVKYREKIKDLKLIIFDVDGVFTDGSVYLNKEGNEMLKFSRIDGRGISLVKEKGLKTAVISSEDSEIVKIRMKKLKIDNVFVGIQDKLQIFEELKKQHSLNNNNICFLGDDTQDLELIKIAGFSCCPSNAQKIIKENSHYLSPIKGGDGFVRDVCNLILKNLE